MAADPATCSSTQFVKDIAANGTLTCATPAGGGAGWSLTGNSINPGEFLGTTGLVDLVIKTRGNRFIHNFGTNNFFAGVNPGNLTTTDFGSNTGVGVSALSANTTGNVNTAVGKEALASNTIGNRNTAAGHKALVSNTTGSDNTGIGINALALNTT